jgi:exopolysaccharide biosynthesis polyprenyl glycosylphosphotransferase
MQSTRTAVVQSLLEVTDIGSAGVLLALSYVTANFHSMPDGFSRFMETRITLPNIALGAAFLLSWHFLFHLFGVYDAAKSCCVRGELYRAFTASSCASLVALVFPVLSRSHAFGWVVVLHFWVAATSAVIAVRALRRTLEKHIVRDRRDIIILGSGPRALDFSREIQQKHSTNYRVLGFVDSPNGHHVPVDIQRAMLGSLENLDRIIMTRPVDQVLIALPVKSCYDSIQNAIAVCERAGVECQYLPDVFCSLASPEIGTLESQSIVRLKVVQDDYRILLKRFIDIVGAIVGLACFGLPMIVIAIAIKLTSPGPILFVHERYGLGKRRFLMYKFRTMVANAEALMPAIEHLNEAQGPVFKVRHDPRITPLGRILRKTSLDELPQLFNVLIGNMSLVGPRPLINRDVALFKDPWLMRRFSVKPGLTCLWQISGRSDTTFDQWIELDLKYIDSWSLTLDFSILVRTVPAVISCRGAV